MAEKKKERWEDTQFANGNSMFIKIFVGVLITLISSSIGFFFFENANQNHLIDVNAKDVKVLEQRVNSHIEATGKFEELNQKGIDKRFKNIEKNTRDMSKSINIIIQNQILIMHDLGIKSVARNDD